MNVHIVGDSRGLGEFLRKSFERDNYKVSGYSRKNGFIIDQDILKICNQIKNADIAVLNSYANGSQIEYLEKLKNSCKSIVVIGSIASLFPDSRDLVYSENKKKLEEYFNKIAVESKIPMLYLRLSGSAYSDYQLVYDSINFWIKNPRITSVGYSAL